MTGEATGVAADELASAVYTEFVEDRGSISALRTPGPHAVAGRAGSRCLTAAPPAAEAVSKPGSSMRGGGPGFFDRCPGTPLPVARPNQSCRFSPARPAARWAGAMRPRAERGHPRVSSVRGAASLPYVSTFAQFLGLILLVYFTGPYTRNSPRRWCCLSLYKSPPEGTDTADVPWSRDCFRHGTP